MTKRPLPTIGLVAPSFRPHSSEIQAAAAVLRKVGFRVKLGAVALKGLPQYHTPFSNLEARADEFLTILQDPEVDLLFAVDGGMGCGYLLAKIAPIIEALKIPLKPLIGWSDVTYLTTWFAAHGQICFNGASALVDEDNSAEQLEHTAYLLADLYLGRTSPVLKFEQPADVYQEGTCTGVLYAGNFSVLQSISLAPRLAPSFDNAIILFEQHGTNAPGEQEYLFWQEVQTLQLAEVWNGAAGFCLGEIPTGGPYETPQDLFPPISDVINETLPHMTQGPVVSGFRFGESAEDVLIPTGAQATMVAKDGRVDLTVDLTQFVEKGGRMR
jgi:muramoyltetrapeptide carboxypeptidase